LFVEALRTVAAGPVRAGQRLELALLAVIAERANARKLVWARILRNNQILHIKAWLESKRIKYVACSMSITY
jgi:hypothetical protein